MSETYLGNPNLKRSNVNIEFTEETVAEYIKCAKDPVYFIRNYVQIVNVDRGLIPFEMYDFQQGTRNGAWSDLMDSSVADLSIEDIVNLSAYTASLAP